MKTTVLIESHYLPSVAYFSLLQKADKVLIESQESFQKQSYRNRCTILNVGSSLNLMIPIVHKSKHKTINEVEINYTERWMHKHSKSIQSAYGRSPFYEYYADEILALYNEPTQYLFNFNFKSTQLLAKLMGVNQSFTKTKPYVQNPESDLLDYRGLIHPKKNLDYDFKPYNQHFGNNFIPKMSALDLLFCEGPSSIQYL